MGELAFTAEQVAAQLLFELLNGPGQRRLGDVAFLGRAREIQQPCRSQELVGFLD